MLLLAAACLVQLMPIGVSPTEDLVTKPTAAAVSIVENGTAAITDSGASSSIVSAPEPKTAGAFAPMATPPAAIVPARKTEVAAIGHKRQWLGLAIMQHSAATFDAWTTRRVVGSGVGHETNPFMRPAANSAALYPVIQLAPLALDYLGLRLQRSSRPWLRRLWWVPQLAGVSVHLRDGVHNLHVFSAQTQR